MLNEKNPRVQRLGEARGERRGWDCGAQRVGQRSSDGSIEDSELSKLPDENKQRHVG